MIFSLGNLLLQTVIFSTIKGVPKDPKPAAGVGWWIGALLMMIIPAITFLPLNGMGNLFLKASRLFPQQETNNLMFWLLINMVIMLVLFLIWHLFNRKNGANAVSYGVADAEGTTWKKIGLSAVFAIIVIGIAYLSVAVISAVLTVDYRFWIMQLKPMSWLQFKIALRYIIPFLLFYLVFAVALHGQLRSASGSLAGRMIKGAIVTSLGILALLLIYIPLFAGGPIGLTDIRLVLYAIIAIQVLPLFIIVTFFSVYFYEKTGMIYAGAFINALFITWYIVASQATHFPLT